MILMHIHDIQLQSMINAMQPLMWCQTAPMPSFEIEKIIEPGEQDTLCNVLARLGDLPKARVKHAMNCGAVWLQKPGGRKRRARRATAMVRPGDRVAMYYDQAILDLRPPSARCIEDYKRFSVWNKPAGMISQGSRFGDHCSLIRQAEQYFKPVRSVYLVHRIDRETSGLVIVGHDRKMAAMLFELFQKHRTEKRYRALVVGRPDVEGSIDVPLDGRPAQTRYTLLRYDKRTDRSLLDVRIVTGRKHQIRRHLESIGHPVVGDPLYGRGNKNQQGLQLSAYSLKFKCPVSRNEIKIEIDPGEGLS